MESSFTHDLTTIAASYLSACSVCRYIILYALTTASFIPGSFELINNSIFLNPSSAPDKWNARETLKNSMASRTSIVDLFIIISPITDVAVRIVSTNFKKSFKKENVYYCQVKSIPLIFRYRIVIRTRKVIQKESAERLFLLMFFRLNNHLP